MDSKIAEAIKLKTKPVAVIRSQHTPENAIHLVEGRWGCVIALLVAAARGKTAVCNEKNVVCPGGKSGLGLKQFELGWIEYFLSTGKADGFSDKNEHYKKTPELAKAYVTELPQVNVTGNLIFKPLDEVAQDESPDIVIFLVNADQLSGLITLSNFDTETQNNSQVYFGAGCAQAVLHGLNQSINKGRQCMIGLTDPSARKCINKELLSFTIPYERFLEMEGEVANSFLVKETWQSISKRI